MKKLLVLFFFAISSVQAGATISQIRWGSAGDPLHGLTITWSNNGSADSVKWGYTTAYEKGHFPGTKRAGYSTTNSFFKYQFPTLTASTTLYYSLYDSKAKTWGSQLTFATAPPVTGSVFSFCAMGDCRDYPATLTTVSNLASARKPTFTLFNGDLTVDGNSSSEYTTFFTAASNFLQNNLVYHVEGNHDAADSSMFSNLWDIPRVNNQNLYYSYRFGNTIFISLNSNDTANQIQFSWLKSTLASAAADPTITWKILSFHHAFFNSGTHTGDMDTERTTWWKAFDDYGVDLVITGHDHNYQRTYPINLNASPVGTPVANYGSTTGKGRLQIISGGGGAGLYSQTPGSADTWATDIFNETYNYVYCNVDGCKITINAYDQTNALIDSLTLNKNGTSVCFVTDAPALNASPKLLTVSPNPTDSNVMLHYSSDLTGEAVIKIIDITGKEILSEKVTKPAKDLLVPYDLSHFAKGVYNISLTIAGVRENTTLVLK